MTARRAYLDSASENGSIAFSLEELRRQLEEIREIADACYRPAPLRNRRVGCPDRPTPVQRAKLSDADYRAIAELAATAADNPPPFALADDFIRADLG